MNADIRSVPTQISAAPGTDTTTQGLSPFLLERLYIRLGQPTWFWPVVLTFIFVLWVIGSSIAPVEF